MLPVAAVCTLNKNLLTTTENEKSISYENPNDSLCSHHKRGFVAELEGVDVDVDVNVIVADGVDVGVDVPVGVSVELPVPVAVVEAVASMDGVPEDVVVLVPLGVAE